MKEIGYFSGSSTLKLALKCCIPVSFILFMMSCVQPPSHIPKQTTFYGVDFTKYTDRGFLFTPESYTGEYLSVGMVNYIITPEANLITTKRIVNIETGQTTREEKEWRVGKVHINEGLDSLYKIARRMGANAIINFKFEPEVRDYPFVSNPVKIVGWRLSGFAISRKGS